MTTDRLKRPVTPERIQMIRAAGNLTQAQFGAQIGRTGQTVSNWENGTFSPDDIDTIKINRQWPEPEENNGSSDPR